MVTTAAAWWRSVGGGGAGIFIVGTIINRLRRASRVPPSTGRLCRRLSAMRIEFTWACPDQGASCWHAGIGNRVTARHGVFKAHAAAMSDSGARPASALRIRLVHRHHAQFIDLVRAATPVGCSFSAGWCRF